MENTKIYIRGPNRRFPQISLENFDSKFNINRGNIPLDLTFRNCYLRPHFGALIKVYIESF